MLHKGNFEAHARSMQVLHIDRNNYYGGHSASLNLTQVGFWEKRFISCGMSLLHGILTTHCLQLWERFRPGQTPPKSLGSGRDYNVDMVPKFIMSNGNLVKVLVHTDVVKYLEFKSVDGSYVVNKNRMEKVPATDMEALRSPLLGLLEKNRVRKFLRYVSSMALCCEGPTELVIGTPAECPGHS